MRVMLLLLIASVASAQRPVPQINKAFILQAETVIDDADLIDANAPQQAYDAQMATAEHDIAILGRMVDGDVETKIVQELKLMLLTTSTCHLLPLANNSDFSECLARASSERMDAMRMLGRRKVAGAWENFPPAHS